MQKSEYKNFFVLNDSDIEMILEGLESLKKKAFGSEIMSMMFEGLLKPKPTSPPEAHEN